MAEETIYLELSQEIGSHKFYEVIISDKTLSIRYGRIGTQGTQKITELASAEKAQHTAEKKIREKIRKGYERAVSGLRKKRAITRRTITSTGSTVKTKAPILWKFNTKSPAFGIFIDAQHCWVGNQSGQVFTLDSEGQVQNQFALPDGVKCIVADDEWIYAGCDDGKVYDLTGKVPYIAYEIADEIDIYWLDIYDGVLGVSDAVGGITVINHENESQWSKKSQAQHGWMIRCDENGVYHGHSAGVTMYHWQDGAQIWSQKTLGSVLFGWQEKSHIYAGTTLHKIHTFSKTGDIETTYQCDAAVYSCATAEGGCYVFAGDNASSIYCFDQSGQRLWKVNSGCGSALSMQYYEQRLYIVTTSSGFIACIDVSDAAIQAAKEGQLPQTKEISDPKITAAQLNQPLATITQVQIDNHQKTIGAGNTGVILRCYKKGQKLYMQVISEGYHSDWKVQFPKNIRQEGALYQVEGIKESSRSHFYRAYGDIKKIIM
jgi:predicted DNA-binding WGR domain protein